MQAIVDQELCTGCELCAQSCPEVFTMNSIGKAEAMTGAVPATYEASCREAAENCPVEAICIK